METRGFSYIIPWDSGKAPNPWWGTCTLAVCKPVIRRTARPGDLIIGLSPRDLGLGNELVYAMYVAEVMTLLDYFSDPEYAVKKPNFSSDDTRLWMGDNIYEQSDGNVIQHVSAHNVSGRSADELAEKQRVDLSGINVLISSLFWYFGKESRQLDPQLDFLRVGRGHRCFGLREILQFEMISGLNNLDPGIHGKPNGFDKQVKQLEHLHLRPAAMT